MKTKLLISGLLLSAIAVPVLAQQTNAPNSAQDRPAAAATTSTTASAVQVTGWRASKIIGVDVYNENNESLGDINEVLIDQSGKVTGVLIGVGGFLGIGQRDVLVTMDKLKFVNEPRAASTAARNNVPANSSSNTSATTTTGAGTAANTTAGNTTTGNTSRTVRAANERWYPDHAILTGATKDSLKGMSAFKYD